MKLYTILVAATIAVMCAVSSCKAKVSACKTEDSDKITRVLAIGNSFSEDALDSYFHSICEAAGRKVIVGNLYIGGCPIDRHYKNAQTNEAAYRFRRIGLDGNIIESHDTRLGWAIGSDNWDIVTFQQASGVSGKYGSYANLPFLIAYVDSLVADGTHMAWHQTWAYATDSRHPEFPNYDCNQVTMYDSIMVASERAMTDNPRLTIIIPSGTAVQNARLLSGDYDLTRDGYHLDPAIGRYIASCVWYEAIFGESVIGNSFIPEGMTPGQTKLAQEAAHAAMMTPFGKRSM
ncbi:MAG: DUF4886 domain-containing protein [Clostridiales bacterium]|nr:DUF4886 domain-containing protein [Clostridiales bacterium]